MIWISSELGTEQQCLDFAERLRWPRGARCVRCGSARVFKFLAKATTRKGAAIVPARRLYECVACGHQFSVTTGTLFHDTHLPLVKWFFATALIINTKGAITARQLQRDLQVSYQTAWYVRHRIRETLDPTPEND